MVRVSSQFPVLEQSANPIDGAACASDRWTKDSTLASALLTPFVLLVHGYHPFADDGGIYVAGIKKLIDPSLYQWDAVFVTAHAHWSVFGYVLAAAVRYGHLPLPGVLFACQLFSIFLFLLGASRVAARVFTASAARWGALLLMACWFTLPVAGTSLFLMDPYVTARSFSTPFSLFALGAVLDRDWGKATLWMAAAALVHPLMAGFATIFLFATALAQSQRWRTLAAFAGFGILFCAILYFATWRVPSGIPSSEAALSRSYFFLSTWEWYEYPGLAAPLFLLFVAVWRTRGRGATGSLAIAGFVIGSAALIVSLCFVHRSGSFLLARIQVLRAFHIIYLAGTLLLGGFAGWAMRRRPWIAALVFCALSGAMFAGQRSTYPASDPIEWPGMGLRNPWQQAFLWICFNTPKNAVFALDADYIESIGEDAQGFRATAERSAIADWYKDGGVASISPAAQDRWWREVHATEKLNLATDAERETRLLPLGATWIVLPARAVTGLPCPYSNQAVRVCQLSVR